MGKYRYAIYSKVLKQYFYGLQEVSPEGSFPVFVDKLETSKLSNWFVSRFWMLVLKWGCEKEIRDSLVFKRILPMSTKMGLDYKFNFGEKKKSPTLGDMDDKKIGDM
jgi:hypothetical protein